MLKPKIVLALPTGLPLKNGQLPKQIQKFAQEFAGLVPDFDVQVMHNDNPREAHAVNMLIDEFRNTPRAEWFVLWNRNVQAKPMDLFTLLNSGKAVIGALCTNCEENSQWLATFYPDLQADENGILAVPELGMGLKCYHRSVFDLLEKSFPELSYIFDNSGRTLTAFCQERMEKFLDYRRLLPPAYYLDFLCRNAQIGIFVHTKIVLQTRDIRGVMHPLKTPFRPWMFKREPPPVCAEDLPEVPKDPRPIGVYIQWCFKDQKRAEQLHDWISEKQDIPCGMIEGFGDKYPKGPNDNALGIIRTFTSPAFKAYLIIEPDCVPLTPDWLEQLSEDWDRCAAAGKLIMGSWHPVNTTHPTIGHLNGNLMFSPDLAKKITIPDVPDNEPWDTWLADVFAPVWARTGLIKNLNRHRTATLKQMTEPECGTKPPVLIHGVRDNSAWDLAEKYHSHHEAT